MRPSRITCHCATIGKYTVATNTEIRRGDNAVRSPRQGDIYGNVSNDQIGSVDYAETPGGGGTIGNGHGTNTCQVTIKTPG
jgi:hypothetical protein